jgi:hypothetical protein
LAAGIEGIEKKVTYLQTHIQDIGVGWEPRELAALCTLIADPIALKLCVLQVGDIIRILWSIRTLQLAFHQHIHAFSGPHCPFAAGEPE